MSYFKGDRVRAKEQIGPVTTGTKGVVQADSQLGDPSVLVKFEGQPGPIDAPVTSIEPDTSAAAGPGAAGAAAAALALVYVVANHSRQEIYVGTDMEATRDWRDHCRASAARLPGWLLDRDDLQLLASFRRRPAQARSLAHELAQGGSRLRTYCLEAAEWEDEGYRVYVGGHDM